MRVNVSSHDLKVSGYGRKPHHGRHGRPVVRQIGHGRQEIADAVRAQMSELSYYNTFFKTTHPPVIELSQMLAICAGAISTWSSMSRSGSEANDTILRLVRTTGTEGQPDKKVVITRKNAYHGSTVGRHLARRHEGHARQGDLPIPGVHHIDQPYWFGEGMVT
jgi:putrescine aminotransferase